MKQSKPDFDEQRIRNTTWSAAFLTVAGLAFFGFAISAVNFLDWQDYVLVGFPLVFAGVTLASIFIIRRGYLTLGSGIVFSMNLFVPLLMISIIKDTLWTALSYVVVSSALLIWRALPRRSWRWSITATVTAMIIIVVIEIMGPSHRFANPPAFNTFMVLLISILSIAFVVQAVRQAWGNSMRNKLMAAFIGVTLAGAGSLAVYVYTSTSNILQQGLEGELTQHVDGVATDISTLLNEQVNTMTTLSLNQAVRDAVETQNHSYVGDANAIQSTLDAKDKEWRAADAANNNKDFLVQWNLTNAVAQQLIEYQQAFPPNVEVFVTDVYGGLVGATDRTSDYYQADEGWWQAAYNNGQGGIYIGNPEFDTSAKALAVIIALPIRNHESGKIIGILRTTYQASAFNAILGEQVGQTGKLDLFFPGDVTSQYHNGQLDTIQPEEYAKLQAVAGQGMVQMNYEGTPSILLQKSIKTAEVNSAINNLNWIVIFHQHQDEAFAPLNAQIRGTLVVMAIIMLLAVAAAFILSLFLVRPITQLTQTAEKIAAGNLDSRSTVTSSDEIGVLASTFNSMTAQLQSTLHGLEQRVAARTKDLETVAEVGTATATILESKKLLQEVVDLTKERFNLYHSHIYLLDEKGENLILSAGAGEPGRIMVSEGRSISINREQSLVARAARERKGVTVNDVTQEPNFLPNPLLPDTHSELAVPMIVGGNVIGVFDIQSEQVGRFSDSDINIQTTLAAQLATSIQNVRSFEQSKKQAELESMVNTIGQKIQRTTSIEETLQTAIRELGTAIGASRVKASLAPIRQGDANSDSRN